MFSTCSIFLRRQISQSSKSSTYHFLTAMYISSCLPYDLIIFFSFFSSSSLSYELIRVFFSGFMSFVFVFSLSHTHARTYIKKSYRLDFSYFLLRSVRDNMFRYFLSSHQGFFDHPFLCIDNVYVDSPIVIRIDREHWNSSKRIRIAV